MASLIPAAMKKAGLVWLEIDLQRPIAAWHVWHNDRCYILHGGAEQTVPGLAEAAQCHVITRSSLTYARTARWLSTVHSVPSGSAEWDELLPLLVARRLNLTDAGEVAGRWARDCVLSRVTPAVSTPA